MRPSPTRKSDDGAMLVLALLIITVVALVTGALLTLSGSKFAATINLRKLASASYAADAAAKVAINDIEYGTNSPGSRISVPSSFATPWVYNNNIDGTGCFGATGSTAPYVATKALPLQNFYVDSQSNTTESAIVTCQPVPGTGISGLGLGAGGSTGGTGGSGGTGTGRAVTILGTGGLSVTPLGTGNNALFDVRGDIASKGQVKSTHGQLFTDGNVYAPSCPGVVSSAPNAIHCPYSGAVTDPLGSVDPDSIAADSSGNWKLGTYANCAFTAGYYPDVTPLNNCTNATFAPGTYYFDFHNNNTMCGSAYCDPEYSGQYGTTYTSDVWTINGTVRGGQATSSSSIPGSCVNPIDDITAKGVQFVFGGDSQMSLGSNASVELCGTYNNGNTPIVLYGLDGNTTSRGALLSNYAATPTALSQTAGSATPAGFSAKPNGTGDVAALSAAGDNKTEFWSTTSGGSASLSLGGFDGSGIPPGSSIKSVALKVWHQEVGNITPSLKLKVGSAAATATTNQPLSGGTILTPDTIDLTADLAPVIAAGNLNSTSLVFAETAKNGSTTGSSTVDAAQLLITYWSPVLRGQTTTAVSNNCIVSTTSPCDVISTSKVGSGFKGSFVVQGAVYIPAATINVALGNQTGVVSMRWGLVAYAANLGSQPQFPFAYPVVSIPQQGPGLGSNITGVDLKVYVCGGVNCTPDTTGTPALTSRVLFTDPADATTHIVSPTPGARQINILSWAEQR